VRAGERTDRKGALGLDSYRVLYHTGDMRIYVVLPKSCGVVTQREETTSAVPSYHHETPMDAWSERRKHANDCGVSLDGADYVVVGADLTGEVDNYGAHVAKYDWADLHAANGRLW
jgi:hypothetical protein